jgi:ADP-heptose:LPS heptosyltransferase
MPEFGKSLLIVHPGALGDVLVTAPVIARLRKRFQRIDALCQGTIGKLARALGVIDGYMPFEASGWASLYAGHPDARTARLLTPYSDIILFSLGETLSEAIRTLTRAGVHRVPPRPDAEKSVHVTRHLFDSLQQIGFIDSPDQNPPVCAGYDDTPPPIDRRISPANVVIHPGSGSRKKNWPVTGFVRLAELLKSDGLEPEFVLGPAELSMRRPLSKRPVGNVLTFSDPIRLSERLKKTAGYIGNDSGVTHLAAFLGLPAVAVFGPSDPERWHPLGPRTVVVRPPGLDCRPCFETRPDVCDQMECLNRTTPEMVREAFYSVLGSTILPSPDEYYPRTGALPFSGSDRRYRKRRTLRSRFWKSFGRIRGASINNRTTRGQGSPKHR